MARSDTNGSSAEDSSPNSIAVIGMACKFPGADSVEDFWRILDAGQSMLSEPPSGRFPTHQHPRNTDKTVYHGNYLENLESFDHRFFKKSSREAASMDPQQRLLLEVCYQALESAGFFGPLEPDLDVGCFIGVCASDYNDNVASHASNAFSALGTLRAFVPGRVSHFFGLSGPSIAIDTACSSSAVAIDAACKAILHGDCKSALAGGVSVFTSPFFFQNLAAASFLSPTGASKSFDSSADGYCRGEGVGIVALKQLSQAVADGDSILGTIMATSVRQSSNKVPITVPYSPSQTMLYRKLLSTAGITAEKVTYIEAHGTGTPVGDPLEFEAIKEVFGSTARREPLRLGSVKGNIGHTEGASGVAGLIKTILMMQNRAIPKQANYVSPHPKIGLIPGKIDIPTRKLPWTADELVACVNNYGAAGSIAAMVVKEAPPSNRLRGASAHKRGRYPLIVTANNAVGLGRVCAKLGDFATSLIRDHSMGDDVLASLAFNISDKQNRSLPSMLTTTASNPKELVDQLRAVASDPEQNLSANKDPADPVILVFGGQTARSIGLSRSVYENSSLLSKHLHECDQVLRGFGHRGIFPDIFDANPTDDVVMLQTMQFSLHYACAQSWIECGLKVDSVLGHSFGELVALTVAGVLSLSDGLRLVYGRAFLMRDQWGPEKGAMMALEAGPAEVRRLLSFLPGLEVACYNGPTSYVLVGPSADITRALSEAGKTSSETGTKARVLNVTHGFHSKLCEPILPDLEKLARSVKFNKPSIHVETCSEGATWSDFGAELITSHARRPVYFGDAVKRIQARYGACTWLEAGSNSSVTSMARRALQDVKSRPQHTFFPVNLTQDDGLDSLADTTVKLWRNGHHVQFWPFHRSQRQHYRSLMLPPYQFEKNNHWLDFDLQAGGAHQRGIDLPQAPQDEPEPDPVLIRFSGFQAASDPVHGGQQQAIFTIDPGSDEWKALVSGHSVLKENLCPAPLYIELVLQAAQQIAALNSMPCLPFARIDDLEMPSPLGLSQETIIQLVLTPIDQTGSRFNFTFLSKAAAPASDAPDSLVAASQKAISHAVGLMEIIPAHDTGLVAELERTRKLLLHMGHLDQNQRFADLASRPGGEAAQGALVYKLFSQVVQYHDFYQGVTRVASTKHSSGGMVAAEVCLPEAQPGCTQALLSNPVAIDNFFQVPGIYANCLAACPPDEVFVSTHVDRIQISPEFRKLRDAGSWNVFAMSTELSDKESSNDIFVTDQATGQLVFIAFGAKFSRVRTTSIAKILSRANRTQPSAAGSENSREKHKGEGRAASSALSQLPVQQQPRTQDSSQNPPTTLRQEPRPTTGAAAHNILSALQSTESRQPRPQQIISVESKLRELLSKMTDFPESQFHVNANLVDVGIDSLMATEILSEIQRVFEVSIPLDRFTSLQTFGALCGFLDANESKQHQRPETKPTTQLQIGAVSHAPLDSRGLHIQEVPLPVTGDSHTRQVSTVGRMSPQVFTDVPTLPERSPRAILESQLASLLGSHLDCPPTKFGPTTNLADLGLDSLLSMELMTDIQKMFGVSLDLSSLGSDIHFGQLADTLVSAVESVEASLSSSIGSSSAAATLSRPSGVSTPNTASSGEILEEVLLPTRTKEEIAPLPNGNLECATREFEDIKCEFDRLAEEYCFSDFYTTVYDKQRELVLAYVLETFLEQGMNLAALTAGDPIPRLSVAGKHERMIDVFNQILAHNKVADYNGQDYVRSDGPLQITPSKDLFSDIVARFPQHAREHELLSLCGPNMSKFLTGTMDPLSVLFGTKKNRNILEDVYSKAPMFVINSELLTTYLLRTFSKSVPGPGGKFKIIELGAGTGATTRWIVDRLVQQGIPIEYTFTDISASLVSASKNKFAAYDCMKYATIDIEKSPPNEYQGAFDVVLATNCIHATSNLHNSLANIRTLLRPSGFVALVELTTRNFWLDMVFGLLDGWWLFDDGRPYVLATPEFWDASMRQAGFQHVSWTGGHTRESEVCRVIVGFRQAVVDGGGGFSSIPQDSAGAVETVVFAHTDRGLPLRADVYHPSPSQAAAHGTWVAAMLVHGGGHVMLSRKDLRPRQIQLLLGNGVLPIAVDYRLCPETTILDGPIADVGAAYAWVRNKLPSLKLRGTNINERLEPERALVVGWSTGGTLAMSLAWTSAPRDLPPPDAILAFYCPTDYEDEFWRKPNVPDHSEGFSDETYDITDGVFPAPITAYNVPPSMMAAAGWIAPKDARSRVVLHMNWKGQTLPVLFRGLPSGSTTGPTSRAHAALYNTMEQPPQGDVIRASPYAQVVRGNYRSPTHIVFGTKDDLIPWQQAQRTVEAMKKAGIEAGLTLAPGQPHLFDMYRDPDGIRWGHALEGYRFLLRRIGRDLVSQ